MRRHHFGLVPLAVAILIGYGESLLLPKRMRIGNCKGCVRDCEAPPATTEPPTSRSLKPEVAEALTTYTMEVSEVIVISETIISEGTGSSRHRRSLKDLLRPKRQVSPPPADMFTTFRVQMIEWSSNINILDDSDLEDIVTATDAVRLLRGQIESRTITLTVETIAIARSTVRVSATFISDVYMSIESDNRMEVFEVTQSTYTNFQSTVTDISASLSSLETSVTIGSSSSITTTVVTEIFEVFESIVESGASVMTQDNLDLLTGFQNELDNTIANAGGSIVVTQEDMTQIQLAAAATQTVQARITEEMSVVQIRGSLQNTITQYSELLSATSIVQSSISEIRAAQESVQAGMEELTYTISGEYSEVYESLESLELISQESISTLRSFRSTADEIISNFDDYNVQIVGLQMIRSQNEELQRQLFEASEELSARSSVLTRAEVLEEAIFILTQVVDTTQEMQTQGSNIYSATLQENVDTFSSFVLSINITEITETNVDELYTRFEDLRSNISISSGSDTVNVDALLDAASSSLSQATEEMVRVSRAEEQVLMQERVEIVQSYVNNIREESTSLMERFSASAVSSDTTSIESVISDMIPSVSRFSSQSYIITDEDIVTFTAQHAAFMASSSEIQAFSSIDGLDELSTLAASASSVLETRSETIGDRVVNKKSLNKLEYMSLVLISVEEYALTLTESASPSFSPASLLIVEITNRIQPWSQSTENIQMIDIEQVDGLFYTLQRLLQPNEEVSGISDLQAAIGAAQANIATSEEEIIEMDQRSEAVYSERTSFSLISENLDSMQELLSLTESEEGEMSAAESQVITNVTIMIEGLVRRTTDILEEEVVELFEASRQVADLIDRVRDGTLGGTIPGLEESLARVEEARNSLREKMSEEETNIVDILASVQQAITNTRTLLNTLLFDDSTDTSNYVTERSQDIDDFHDIVVRIRDQPNLVTEQELQLLYLKHSSILRFASSITEFTIVEGYTVTIVIIIQIIDEAEASLTARIAAEEQLNEEEATFTASRQLLSNINEIVSSLIRLLVVETVSIEFQPQSYVSTLEALAEDPLLFEDREIVASLMTDLWDLEDQEEKPNNAESILESARSAQQSMRDYFEDLQISRAISRSIRHASLVSDITTDLGNDIDNAIDEIEPTRLLGVDSEEVNEIVVTINVMILDFDSTSTEEITSMVSGVSGILSSVNEAQEGIGNILTLRRSVAELRRRANRRRREQEDRAVVTQQIDKVDRFRTLINETRQTVTSIIDRIGIISTTRTDQVTEIGDLTNILSVSVEEYLSNGSEEDIRRNLDAIKELVVVEGEDIPGISVLDSTVDQCISSVQVQREFLVSTESARRRVDIYSTVTQTVTDIKSQLEIIMNSNRGNDDGTAPGVFVVVSELLTTLISNEEVSYSIRENLETALSDLRNLNLQRPIPIESISEVFELSRTVSYSIDESLDTEMRISDERLQVRLYERSTKIFTQAEEIFESTEGLEPGADEGENEQISRITEQLQEASENSFVEEEHIDLVQELVIVINTTSASTLTQSDVSNIQNATNYARQIRRTVQERISTSRQSVIISATRTKRVRVISMFQQISDHIESITFRTGIVSSFDPEPEIVSELRSTIENFDADTASSAQMSELTERVAEFRSSISGNNGVLIRGLRQLTTTVVSRTEILRQSNRVFSTLNEATVRSESINRASTVFSRMDREIDDTINSYDENVNDDDADDETSEAMMSVLSEATEGFSSDSIERSTVLAEDALEKFMRLRRAGVIVRRRVIIIIIIIIRRIVRIIRREVTRSVSRTTRLRQSIVFTETTRTVRSISEITGRLLEFDIDEDTEVDDETTDVINRIIILFRRYESNAVDISEEDASFFRESRSVLTSLVRRRVNLRIISTLNRRSTSVALSFSREAETLTRESQREQNALLRARQVKVVSRARSVFREIYSSITVDDNSEEGIRVHEVDRISEIITRIEQGTATGREVALMEEYTETLSSSWRTQVSRGRITGVRQTLGRLSTIQGNIERKLTEDSFTSSYSEEVYEQKQFKSLLLEAQTTFENLIDREGDGTGEPFTSPLFEEITRTADRINYEYSSTYVETLRSQIGELRETTMNIAQNTRITGLSVAYRRIQSTTLSVESTISRSYSIQRISEETGNLEVEINLLSRLENAVSNIEDKEGNQDFLEMNDTIIFLRRREAYTSEELIELRDRVNQLEEFNQNSNEGLNQIESLRSSLDSRIRRITTMQRNILRVQRSESQNIYTNAASRMVRNVYRRVTTVRRTSGEEETMVENAGVARFSMFLQSIDMGAISSQQMAEINTRTQEFFGALENINTSWHRIAQFSSVSEQLREFSYASEQYVRTLEIIEREQRTSVVLQESNSAIRSILDSITINSGEEITVYEDREVITNLFNFIEPFASDFRLIPSDFQERLAEFDLSSIADIPDGTGIRYLEETRSLLQQFLDAQEETENNIRESDSIVIERDLQVSLSRFTSAIEQYLFSDQEEGESEDTDGGSPDTGESGEGESQDTDGGSPDTGESGESDFFLSDTELERNRQMFREIISNINELSYGSNNFNSQTSSSTIQLMYRFMETNVRVVFARFSRSYLTSQLSTCRSVSTQITSSINTRESRVKVQRSYRLVYEVTQLLYTIQRYFQTISESGMGSSDTNEILTAIKLLLERMTNINFFTQEDVNYLRQLTFRLSVAITFTETITLEESGFGSFLTSRIEVAEAAYSSQSSFVTTSNAASSTSQVSIDQQSGFISYSSTSQASAMQITYSKEESVVLAEINRVSQTSYVVREYQSLLVLATTSLENLLEYVNSSNGSDEEEEENYEEEEENEAGLALSQISLILRSSISNIEGLEVSSLSEFAALIRLIQSFIDSSIEIKSAQIGDSLTLISQVNETINEYIVSSSSYSSEAQRVLNIQESSSSLVELSRFVDGFEVSDDSASESDLSEEDQEHIDYISSFVMEFSLRGFVSGENSLKLFRRSLRYLMQNSIRISFSTLTTWRNFMVRGRASRTESSTQVASEGAILRTQTQRDSIVYSRGSDVINDYSTLIGRFTNSLDGSANSAPTLIKSCRRIIIIIIIIIRTWSFRVDINMIIKIERYYKELDEMLPLLAGAQLPDEFEILQGEVIRTQAAFSAALERIDAEISENSEFIDIDEKYQLFSQMDSYFMNAYNIEESGGQTDEIEVDEVSVLYGMLSSTSSQQSAVTIEEIFENFRSLVSTLRNVTSVTRVSGYARLVKVIQDRAEYQQASRRARIFSTVAATVSRMSGSIPLSLASQWQSYSNLVYNEYVIRLYQNLQVFQRNLYSVRRSSIRSLSGQTYTFRTILEQGSLNIAYLLQIDESLSNIQSSSGRYGRLALEQYEIKRASRTYSMSANALSEAVENIGNYIINNTDESETSLEVNDLSRTTFEYFINNTLSYSSLPIDFGSEIQNFNFASSNALSEYNRSILIKIIRVLRRLMERHSLVQSSLQYMQRTDLINRIIRIVRDTIQNLRRILAENSDAFNENIDADGDVTSPGDGTSSTDASNEVEEGAENDEEHRLTIDEVLVRFANLTESFIRYEWDYEGLDSEDFEQYGRILSNLSPNLKVRILNLPETIDQLSLNIIYLYQLVQSSESAYQSSKYSSLLQDISKMNWMISYFLQSLGNTEVTSQFNSLLLAIQEYYEVFSKGLGYITQDDIISCLELVFEFTSLDISEGDVSFDASGLLSLITDINYNLSDVRGFLSVQSYYFETYMQSETIYSETNTMNRVLRMGFASQLSYGVFEIINILRKMLDVIQTITEVDDDSDASQPEIFGDIAATVKTAESNPEFIHIGTIFTLSEQLFILETTADSIALREELILGFHGFITNKIDSFEYIASFMNPYGRTSTQVLILEQATNEINRATVALGEWISREIGSTTTAPISSVTTVSPVTVGSNSLGSGSFDAQGWFEEVSEILVEWAFDSSSISFKSLIDVMEFLRYLETSCETVVGLHIWEYLLISANENLSGLLEDLYIDQTLGRADIEEAVFRYTYGKHALDSLLDILGTDSDNEIESSETSTSSGGDNSTEIEGMQNNIDGLISSSRLVMETWRDSLEVGLLGGSRLKSSSSEISDLVMSGGVLNGSAVDDLRSILLEEQNFMASGITALNLYSEQTTEERSYIFGKSFLMQAKNLAEYSLLLIENIRNETDGESDESIITDEDEDCLSLDCNSDLFLSAVQSLELGTDDTVASENSPEAITGTSVFFMDGYDNEANVYDDARQGVYGFARALQSVRRQDYGTFDSVTSKLGQIVDVVGDRLETLETQSVTVTANVSAYFDTGNE